MYLFYNLCTIVHVSNDHFVHHQEFMIYCILQLCTNHAGAHLVGLFVKLCKMHGTYNVKRRRYHHVICITKYGQITVLSCQNLRVYP
jgi:hypothetical protein